MLGGAVDCINKTQEFISMIMMGGTDMDHDGHEMEEHDGSGDHHEEEEEHDGEEMDGHDGDDDMEDHDGDDDDDDDDDDDRRR